MRIIRYLVLLAAICWSGSSFAGDRHAGYYYPEASSIEDYAARAPVLDGNDRKRRRDFVSGIVREIADEPYPPTYAMFAKGSDAEKLIFVAVQDGYYNTVYRARALFAALTALARQTPLFAEFDKDDRFTFFDLCYMLGFEQITITDGLNFTHQVKLIPPSFKKQ